MCNGYTEEDSMSKHITLFLRSNDLLNLLSTQDQFKELFESLSPQVHVDLQLLSDGRLEMEIQEPIEKIQLEFKMKEIKNKKDENNLEIPTHITVDDDSLQLISVDSIATNDDILITYSLRKQPWIYFDITIHKHLLKSMIDRQALIDAMRLKYRNKEYFGISWPKKIDTPYGQLMFETTQKHFIDNLYVHVDYKDDENKIYSVKVLQADIKKDNFIETLIKKFQDLHEPKSQK